MHRSGDLAPVLAIVLGVARAGLTYDAIGDALRTDVDIRIEGREDERRESRRSERDHRSERRLARDGEPARGCAVPFRIDSRGPGWSVVGVYSGLAALTREGLVVELRGATTAQPETPTFAPSCWADPGERRRPLARRASRRGDPGRAHSGGRVAGAAG